MRVGGSLQEQCPIRGDISCLVNRRVRTQVRKQVGSSLVSGPGKSVRRSSWQLAWWRVRDPIESLGLGRMADRILRRVCGVRRTT